MISRVSTIIISISLFFQSYSQESSYEKMNLKGEVKTILQTEYGMGDNASFKRIKYGFDIRGNKTEEVLTDESGAIQYKSMYRYDKEGRMISESLTDNQVDFSLGKSHKYSGNRLIETRVSSKGKLITVMTYRYDTVNVVKRGPDSLKISYNDADKNWEITTFRYDRSGNLVEEINEQSDGDYFRYLYKYDENNRRIEKAEFNRQGRSVFKAEYEYDEYGNVSREYSGYTGGMNTNLTYVYVYDDKGNWVEMREQSEGKTFVLSIRSIEYYK